MISHAADPDPERAYRGFLVICGNYYTIDGVTPTSGTPTTRGFGIVFRSANAAVEMISLTRAPSGCSAGAQIDHVTVKHVEFDGVNPQYGVNITACRRTSNIVTLTLASSPAWVVGDKIDVQGVLPSSFRTGQSGYGVAIATVSGNTLTFAQNGNDEICSGFGYATLNYAQATGVYAKNLNQTYDAIAVTDSFFHDLGMGALGASNISALDFSRNYVARNRSTYTWHANGLNLSHGGSFAGEMGPITIANNIWEDITGTFVAGALDGTVNGFDFYNNLVFCSQAASAAVGPSGRGGVNSAASPQCGVSQVSTDNNGNSTIRNAHFYGNTLANVTASPTCGFHFHTSASTGDAKNNLFWNCYSNVVMGNSVTPGNFTNSYNTILASDTITHRIACGGGTNCSATGDYVSGAAPNPFANDSDSTKDFRLGGTTPPRWLTDGVPLAPPYHLDLVGAPRGMDGSWDRGAFERDAPKISPPTNLTVVTR